MINRFEIAQTLLTYLRANTTYEVVADGQEKELWPNAIYLTEKLAFGQTRITLGPSDNDSANCFYQIDVRTPVYNGKGQNLIVCTEIQALFPKGKQTSHNTQFHHRHSLLIQNASVDQQRRVRPWH